MAVRRLSGETELILGAVRASITLAVERGQLDHEIGADGLVSPDDTIFHVCLHYQRWQTRRNESRARRREARRTCRERPTICDPQSTPATPDDRLCCNAHGLALPCPVCVAGRGTN